MSGVSVGITKPAPAPGDDTGWPRRSTVTVAVAVAVVACRGRTAAAVADPATGSEGAPPLLLLLLP